MSRWTEEAILKAKSKGYDSVEEMILDNIESYNYVSLYSFQINGMNIPDSILKQKLKEEDEKEERSSEEQLSAPMMS